MVRALPVVSLLAITLCGAGALAGTQANHFALFGGVTSAVHEDHGATHRQNHVTLGLEYERGLSFLDDHLGVELVGEWVLAEHTETILGGGLVVHPWGGLRVIGAPAVAIFHDHKSLLLRGTLAYDFHLSAASLSPTVSADWVDHHVAYVAGLAVGLGL